MAGFSKFWQVFPGLAKLPVTGNNKKRDRDILHEDHEKGNRFGRCMDLAKLVCKSDTCVILFIILASPKINQIMLFFSKFSCNMNCYLYVCHWRRTWKGKKEPLLTVTKTGTVSKASSGEASERWDRAHMGLPDHVDTTLLELNWMCKTPCCQEAVLWCVPSWRTMRLNL